MWKMSTDKDHMRYSLVVGVAVFFLTVIPVYADESNVARPNLLLRESVEGMPKGSRQEIKVLTATIQPGGKTVFHTHRFPVTVYILEGAFTLEMDGRPTVTVSAGQAMVEPPNVKMTGYNKSTTEPMRVVVFYVSDPDIPFLDPIKTVN
jgi:quercetin dioxygenase-like cupin family protein